MGAFDLQTKKIQYKGDKDGNGAWNDDEYVIIRELCYGDLLKLQNSMMDNVTLGESQDKVLREQIKLGTLGIDMQQLRKIESCIDEWTLTGASGKKMQVSIENIRKLNNASGQFIMEQIQELNPERDDDFQGESN